MNWNSVTQNISIAVLVIIVLSVRGLCLYKIPKKALKYLWLIVVLKALIPYTLSVPIPIGFHINSLTVYSSASASTWIVTATVYIYAIGALLTLSAFIIPHIRARRGYRLSEPLSNEYIQNWKASHSTARRIQIYQSKNIDTPLSYGVFNPVIVLPQGDLIQNQESLSYVLSHEYIHIKEFDIIYKWCLAIIASIYWYNPFAWVLFFMASRDLELSCDESLLRFFRLDKRSDYARMLVRYEERKGSRFAISNGFSKNAIEERIVSVMKFKKTRAITLVFSVIITMLLLGAAFLTGNAESGNKRLENNNTDSPEYIANEPGESYFEEYNDGSVTYSRLDPDSEGFDMVAGEWIPD
jgi:beta-lactamase regulating signal transducer with metallopeptidase domain